MWHLWHEPEHLFVSAKYLLNDENNDLSCETYIQGEFEYPDVKKWTDAELGIPPDDVDE